MQVLSLTNIIIALTFSMCVSTFSNLQVAASNFSNYPEIFPTCSQTIRKNTISKSATQVQLRCHFGQSRQLSCLAHPGELEVKVPLVAQS